MSENKKLRHKKPAYMENKTFDVYFMQGNSVAMAKCEDVIFPGASDVFMTLLEVVFPEEEKLDAIHLPKHLVILVKEYNKEAVELPVTKTKRVSHLRVV